MERTFEFIYFFNSVDFKICFEYEITKSDIERTIRGYINNKNIFTEDIYLIEYNNNIEIEFNIVNITGLEYSIEVDNVLIYE